MTGVVLAGGASTRMGRDKALLEIAGEPLAARVARRIAPACERVVVASGDGRRLARLGLEEIADASPGSGPLGGILAGLRHARTPLVAVVAMDMPDASAAVLRVLRGHWSEDVDAVVPRDEHGLQPLHAVYATSAEPTLTGALGDGERSVVRALERLRVRIVEPEAWAAADPSGSFARNVNRPEDLP